MTKRLSFLLALLLLTAAFCLPAYAADQNAPVITSAAAFEDGFVLAVDGLKQDALPDGVSVLYGKLSNDGTQAETLQEVSIALPLPANKAAVVSGLQLLAGSNYTLQIKAVFGESSVLSDSVTTIVVQGAMPTAPNAISFVNKTESVFEGQTLDLSMMIDPLSSGKAYLTFVSNKEKIATVDDKGVVTGIAKGKATITASGVTATGKKLKATVTVQVNRPVTQLVSDKTDILLAVGKKSSVKINAEPNTASDKSVLFASNNESIATVDKKGNVRGVAAGSCVITAISASNPEISTTINVTIVIPVSKITLVDGNIKLYIGQTLPLSVGYLPANATIQAVTFKSSAEKYATVDEGGIVTGIAKGKATITATAKDGSGTKATKQINVLQQPQSVTFSEPPAKLSVGTNKKMTAIVSPKSTSDKTLVWTSSNESIATVSKSGVITPLYPGQVTITAASKDFSSISASADITVVQPAKKIELSETKLNILVQNTAQLTYIITPDYTTNKAVTWSSNRPEIASVDQNGILTAHKRGTATITVACLDGSGKTAKATINVIQPLYGMTLDKEEIRVGLGDTGSLTAVLDPLDASNSKVRWYSSNPNVAQVSGSSIKATVTGIAWGDAEITAVTDEGDYTDTAIVHIGDYNKALDIPLLSLVPRDGGGYTPFLQLRNLSNMEITSVNFIIQGFDINNSLLYMGNNHAYVYGKYLQELAPGWQTESIGFYYDHPGNYAGIERVHVAITDYTTSSGVEWHIPLTDRVWAEYSTPEFVIANPGI